MTTSNAFIGHGTVFARGDGASNESFATIADVTSIGLPDISRDMVEISTIESTNKWKEFLGAMKDAGSISIELYFTRANYTTFIADINTSANKNYRITFSDAGGTILNFSAGVSGMSGTIPMNDKVTATITYKLSGQITVTS